MIVALHADKKGTWFLESLYWLLVDADNGPEGVLLNAVVKELIVEAKLS